MIDACPGSTITFNNDYVIDLTSGQIIIDKDLTIIGAPFNVIVRNAFEGLSRVFLISQFSPLRSDGTPVDNITATLNRLTIIEGIDNNGGCILNESQSTLNIINSTIRNCRAVGFNRPDDSDGFGSEGGGIYNSFGSTLNITDSTVADNTTDGGYGGGIHNSGGFVTVTRSTVSGNTTNGGAGGGIFTGPGVARPEAPSGGVVVGLNVINSTISGNSTQFTDRPSAPEGFSGAGGGIFNYNTQVSITDSTITDNSTSSDQGNGVSNFNFLIDETAGPSSLTSNTSVHNTIIAANHTTSTTGDVGGEFFSEGFNLIGNSTGSSGFVHGVNNDQVGSGASPIDPLLGELDNNGGPTRTHALITGAPRSEDAEIIGSSPAIDMGDSQLTTDQRGSTRPSNDPSMSDVGDGSDIGAYEVQFVVPSPTPSPTPAPTATPTPSPTPEQTPSPTPVEATPTPTPGRAAHHDRFGNSYRRQCGNDGIHLQRPGQPTASAGIPDDGAVRDG